MEIKTKFNVGDIIYVIKYNDIQKKSYVDCLIIGKIAFFYNDNSDNELRILYSRRDEYDLVLEKDSFDTKKEAQKECDKRNSEM